MKDQICSLCSWRDFVSECFWFGSDAVNASQSQISLVASPLAHSRIPPATQARWFGGRKHPCTFLLFALNTTNKQYDTAPFKIYEVIFLVLGMKREYSRVNKVFLLTTRGKYSQKKMGGGVGPLPKILTLFMTKICDFPYPFYDLTKNSKPSVMTWLLHQNPVSYLRYN